MFKNYLITALHNLLGDKRYSAINIAGLAMGLAATLLIALYVLDETSYDKHWQNAASIYRINTAVNPNGNGFNQGAGTSLLALPALQRHFPQDITAGSRFMAFGGEIRVGSEHFEEALTRVDAGFLEMFELETLAGDVRAALADPGKLALRADVAQRFFSGDVGDIVGQVLSITTNGVSRDYQIAAVYRFPNGNTVLDLPLFTLLDESALPPAASNWGALIGYSFLQLRSGAAAITSADLQQFTDQNVTLAGAAAGRPSDRFRFELQNIADIHLNSAFDDSRAGGNRAVVMAFTAIAILVLLIGIINFTILSTARATQRAKETALRKTVGASRGELIGQFLGESFCVVLPAILISCVLVELLLPVFETVVGKTLQVSWLAPDTLLVMTAMYFAVSVLGGLYPALVLSRFRPAETFRSSHVRESKASLNLRTLLVVFQFGVSIALIMATGVIYTQVRYAMQRDAGFNRTNLIVIDDLGGRVDVRASKATLKAQVQSLPAVSNAALSAHQPTQTLGMANFTARYEVPGADGGEQQIATLSIDHDFFSTYQTPIVAGRDFSAALDEPAEIFPQQAGGAAPSKVIVNVSASRRLGFSSPAQAVGNPIRFTSGGVSHELTIIGVAADTNFYSMNAVPRAEIYSFSPGFTDVLSIRFAGNPQATVAQLTAVWTALVGDTELSISFVEQNMAAEFAQERIEAQLLVSFSLLAIVIACLGLYGSAAFATDRRTKEIGIRKVMGAEVREIVTLLLWQFSRPVLLANAVAWPMAAWAMLSWLQRFPYRIDTLALIPLCVLAGAIALSIAWLTVAGTTLRVARKNPVYALRYE